MIIVPLLSNKGGLAGASVNIEAMPDRSEANQVVRTFDSLSPSQMQDILNFLRSL